MLGIIAKLMRAELFFPKGLSQTLTLFLMIAIGLKRQVPLILRYLLHLKWLYQKLI
ncbi:sodium-dependent bicarbonate transport family permease [Zooshikella sp. RANM57]|uniref:sodium-dependent bicarbonate transport family permease n=1 Tax=Zooshikella sp. RANM57 TaxID=3425863 RepID=UPI003D6E0DC7